MWPREHLEDALELADLAERMVRARLRRLEKALRGVVRDLNELGRRFARRRRIDDLEKALGQLKS